MNNHSITDEQLLARLAQLDAQVAALHVAQKRAVCSARKWKTIAWITSASVVGVGSLAATQSARTPDVIRARRFEVIDQSDKVVLLAGIGANGGQLDVWANGGTNVIRFGANADGGDVAIWDNAGKGVAGMYATAQGGRIEAVMPDGSGSVVLRAEGTGPALAIADSAGRPRIVATLAGISAGVSVRSAAGNELVAFGASEGEGGVLRVSQHDGVVATQLVALESGGSVACANRDGSRGAVLEVPTTESGGALSLFAPDGSAAITAISRSETSPRLSLFGPNHLPAAVLEANDDNTGIIAFFENGTRVAGLGSSVSGGLLNLAKPDGRAVVVAGAASDADGGAISIRSGTGSQIVRLGVDRIGAGEVAVYDGPGTRKRVLSATAAP